MPHATWRNSPIATMRKENINFDFPSSSPTGGDGLSSSFQLQYGHFLQYWTGINEGNQTQTSSSVQQQAISTPTTTTTLIRRVSFSKAVKVILIPTREEFKQAKIFDQVWWNHLTDFAAFKRSACHELQHFMIQNNIECHKEALRRLYQPSEQEEGDSRWLS